MLLSYTNSKDSSTPHGNFLYFSTFLVARSSFIPKTKSKNCTSCVINEKLLPKAANLALEARTNVRKQKNWILLEDLTSYTVIFREL